MKKLTNEQFIEKAHKVHGNKYDYSKVNYIKSSEKVCIICSEHGEFWQNANDHLNKKGCPKCSGKMLKTTEFFKEEIERKYGNKYDLSKVDYQGAFKKVCIVCHEKDELGNEHGEFWITPTNFLRGKQCPKCSKRYIPTTEEWVARAKKVHNDKYDYSKVNYINNNTEICIICPEHGEFWQIPSVHLQSRCGCSKCANRYIPTTEEWIEKAKKIHGNKYVYSKTEYKNTLSKVCIICPEHGEFWQTAGSHLSGKGCRHCAGNVTKTTEQFIIEATNVHEGKYTYEHCNYINDNTKVDITCPVHGDFQQRPIAHLRGQGCLQCYAANKHLSETKVYEKLKKLYPNVEYQKRWDWLGLQSVDFYLPDFNIAIEYQGREHFTTESYYRKPNNEIIERDTRKRNLCKEHGIEIFYLTFEKNYITENFDDYHLYTSLKTLLEDIIKIRE